MEADLQRFYGIDLGDLYRGQLSVRRLAVLVDHLPPGSAVWAITNGIPEGWTLSDFLLTDLYAAFTGEEHPARPSSKSKSHAEANRASELAQRLRAQRERLAASQDPS